MLSNFKSFLNEERDKEMIKHFRKRTVAHIRRVQNNAKNLAKAFPEIAEALLENASKHDASKFEDPEYEPYLHINWHYKCKKEGCEYDAPFDIEEQMHKATLHHVRTNKHHPEYWDENFNYDSVNRVDRLKPPKELVDGTKMPDYALAEQMCDWVAMSQELESSNCCQKWMDDNINIRWKFTDEQIELLQKYHKALQ